MAREFTNTGSGDTLFSVNPASRQLKAMGGFTGQRAGVFREGSIVADISCLVEAGALVTVKEEDKGRVKFAKYQEHWATRQPEQQAA